MASRSIIKRDLYGLCAELACHGLAAAQMAALLGVSERYATTALEQLGLHRPLRDRTPDAILRRLPLELRARVEQFKRLHPREARRRKRSPTLTPHA